MGRKPTTTTTMASGTPLPFLFLFLFLFISAASNASDSCPSDGSDLSIIPVNSKCSPFAPPSPAPILDTVLSMAKQDSDRLAHLLDQKSPVRIAPGQKIIHTASYVVRVKLGTPVQEMFLLMDTAADTAFVPCQDCTGCAATRLFSPQGTSTFLALSCNDSRCAQIKAQPCQTEDGPCLFNQSYGGDSSFFANLVIDSLTLGRDVVPKYPFGCIDAIAGGSVPAQGLLGLGRGPMSLISRTASLYKSTFSYCLPAFNSDHFSGSLILGPAGQRKGVAGTTTSLLRNPRRPSLYYVNLTGVSVDGKDVAVPPGSLAFNPATGGGTIIDSGTVITRFVPRAYAAVREAYRSGLKGSISSVGAFDTCFDSRLNRAAALPTVTFHFQGFDLALPTNNTIIRSSATLACLSMAAANNVNSVINVIANLQQQNLRILFDVPNSRVGITTEFCS